MLRKNRFIIFCLTLFFALLLTSYGSTFIHAEPEHLKVDLTNENGNQIYGSQRVEDQARTAKLYRAILKLPPAFYSISCPLDRGFRYHLSFEQANNVPLSSMLTSSTGCRTVVVSRDDVRQTDQAFWVLFAETLRVPVKDVLDPPTLPAVYR